MINRKGLKTYSTFAEAEAADRQERWSMTIEERLLALEQLRSCQYPDGESAPRLQRIFESIQSPRS